MKEDKHNEDLLLAINMVYQNFWLQCQGFINSVLIDNGDKTFSHIMIWKDEGSLHKSIKMIQRVKDTFTFFDMIKVDSVHSYHGERVSVWGDSKRRTRI